MPTPLVSIIIPCYNAEKYVAEAIQSALDQTYPNCEVIVIDDGSTDGSLEVIQSFGDKIRWETGPNRGGCVARNRGLELAKGEWIQFLDADDLISVEKIERQMALLSDAPEGGIATCSWRHFEGDHFHPANARPFWKHYDHGVDLLVDTWLEGGFFCLHCWLVPRSLIEQVGQWAENLSADQDGEFFGRVLAAARTVVFVTGVEAYYRKPGSGHVSTNPSKRALQSRLEAWDSVQETIRSRRNDREARKAILRRLRGVAYHARNAPKIIDEVHKREKELWMWDWNPTAPLGFRMLSWVLGVRWALWIRDALKRS